eukprot:15156154-Alexandrium_andersonii.AAC.1
MADRDLETAAAEIAAASQPYMAAGETFAFTTCVLPSIVIGSLDNDSKTGPTLSILAVSVLAVRVLDRHRCDPRSRALHDVWKEDPTPAYTCA